MTAQEMFNDAYRHFVIEGNPRAVVETDDPEAPYRCRYRTPDGNKCVIGRHIPDELYDPELDGWNNGGGLSAHTLMLSRINRFQKIARLFDGIDPWFLDALQGAHDGDPESMSTEDRFKAVAQEYGLTIPAE